MFILNRNILKTEDVESSNWVTMHFRLIPAFWSQVGLDYLDIGIFAINRGVFAIQQLHNNSCFVEFLKV